MQLLANRNPSPTIGDFVRASIDDTCVRIEDDAGAHHLIPLIWVRDNCQCATCRIEATGEHRYFLGNETALPQASSIDVHDGTLTVLWSDGHRTVLDASGLGSLSHIADRGPLTARLWSDDFMPEQFPHDDVVNDHDTQLAFLRAAMQDGLAVVTDMTNESGECIRFLEKLKLPIRDTPFDRLHDVYLREDGYNVAHTAEALPPHTDFASYTWPPSGQLIHMLVNDVAGGEWVNVDGFRVISQLWRTHPDAVQTLATVPIAFREHSDTAESWTRAPIIRIDGQGNVTGIRFSNQLMQPMSPFDPDVERFYHAYHLLASAVNDPANQIEFRGHAGMMQFVHGHRVLHARRAFDGTTGDRHLQDTYFDFDDVASLVALISGEAR